MSDIALYSLCGLMFFQAYVSARVVDLKAKDFIAVTDAEVWELEIGGRQLIAAPFVNVGREHIQVIAPGV